MAKSGKTMVIEIRSADDIRTHNSLQHECADWKWQGGNLIHEPGQQRPITVTPRMAESIAAALAAGVFPVELPYRVEDGTERLALRDEEDPAPPSISDLAEDEYEALDEYLPGAEEATVEFAVIYWQRGERHVEGPFSRRLAEVKARDRGGRIAERTRTVQYGPWTPADERFAEFDKATEQP